MVVRSPRDQMEALLQQEVAGDVPDVLCFWGHTPAAHNPFGPWMLSQWYPAQFVVDGIEYFHAEGFMMAAKARRFGDDGALATILEPGSRASGRARTSLALP